MKKLLTIVVLGLLLNGKAYAELITLTKCYIEKYVHLDKTSHTSKIVNGVVKRTPEPSTTTTTYRFNNFEEHYSHPEFNHQENLLYTLDTVTEIITRTIINSDSYIENFLKKGVVVDKYSKDQYRINDLGGNVASAEILNKRKNIVVDKIDVDFVSNKVFATLKLSYNFEDGSTANTTSSRIYKCKRQK